MSDTLLCYKQIFHVIQTPIWVRDFTEVMKRLDELRQEGVNDLDAFLEQHPELSSECAEKVSLRAVNHAALELFESSSLTELLQGSLSPPFHLEPPEAFQTLLIALFAGNTLTRISTELRTPRGTRLEVHLQTTVLASPPDFHSVITTVVDLTGSSSVEKALREANNFLDAIVENIPDMIFLKEAKELRFVRFNKAGERLLGIPRTETYDRNDYDFFPQDEADFFTAKDKEVLKNGGILDIPEEPIHTAAGFRWLHTKKVPLYHDDGTPAYLLGISEDITELKQAREELALRSEELERSNRELEQFAYLASHDLNEPLRTIDSFVQLLTEELGEDISSDAKDYVEVIQSASRRIRAQVTGLLEISRVGRHTMNRVHTPTEDLLADTLENMRTLLSEEGAKVTFDTLPVVEVDPALFARVFQNLISNAVKFRQQGKAPTIHISCEQEDSSWRFCVKDNGIGFDNRYAEQIFGIFKRLHPVGEYSGSGIGLAICRRIIEDHGGKIWAESEQDMGTCIFFTVPRSEGNTR